MFFLEIFILVSQERAKEDNQCIVFYLLGNPGGFHCVVVAPEVTNARSQQRSSSS